MIGGDNMQTMAWALASAYEGNKKFMEGLSWKSFVKKKESFLKVDDESSL
jgi:hypothetical protein